MRTRRVRPDPIARSAFAGFCFPPDVIVLAVRWYLRFGLSYRDVEELLAERGIEVDHVTVYRWVVRFTPLLGEAARPCRHPVGDRWQVDETYVKVAGRWRYVYRAIDQFGQVVDVFVSPRRDLRAAGRFFERAIGTTRTMPSEVVTDQAPTYPVVLEELLPAAWHHTEQYANNRVEADHGLWVPKTSSVRVDLGFTSAADVRDDRQSWLCDCSTSSSASSSPGSDCSPAARRPRTPRSSYYDMRSPCCAGRLPGRAPPGQIARCSRR
jgi:IS6 family transposase